MLPQAYELPAAILLVLGGALTCFAGYRLFRVVLGIYGFLIGALLTSSLVGVSNNFAMLVAALLGGIGGALLLVFAYFVGVALMGAGLGALLSHLSWDQIAVGDPPGVTVVIAAALGGLAALLLQRYVVVVGTAFAGAWTIIVGGAALAAGTGVSAISPSPSLSEPWIVYPLDPIPGARWVPLAWVLLGIIGTIVQLGMTSKKR
jgi:hypothetical protein